MSVEPRFLVVLLVAFVFFCQIVGAARTFTPIGLPGFRSRLLPFLFASTLFAALSAPLQIDFVIPGCLGLFAAMGLFAWARRSIKGRFFSYVYSDDEPGFLLKAGPFAYIRNPFYASYLLTIISATLMLASVAGVLLVMGATAYFTAAARHEEQKFAQSALSKEYDAYKRSTGRFLPRLTRRTN